MMIEEAKSMAKSANKVQNVLLSKGFDCKVRQLPSSTRTAIEAAKTIRCKVSQIVKSILFSTNELNQPILILASGANRVNEKTIQKLLGVKITKADAKQTRKVTGFAIGGVPPLGHPQEINTLIDEDLMQHELLWAAAGTPHAVFQFKSADIIEMTSGKIALIK